MTKKKKKKKLATDSTGWAVDRLEDDKYEVAEDGTRTRYFLVRWEGDWPPEENPSWEPEENIAGKLVTDYLASKQQPATPSRTPGATPGATPHPKRVKTQKTLSPWMNKFTSVMEAFEGIEEDTAHGAAEESEDDGGGEDEFRVTEDRVATSSAYSKRSAVDLDLAAQVTLFSQKAASNRGPK